MKRDRINIHSTLVHQIAAEITLKNWERPKITCKMDELGAPVKIKS